MKNSMIIEGIDWNIESPFAYGFSESNTLLNLIKSTDKLPLNKGNIKFSDNTWDFSSYTTLNIPKSKLKFNFSNVPNDFEEVLKLYVLIKILSNTIKFQTLNKMFINLRIFFNYLYFKNIFDVESVMASDIKNFFESKKNEIAITSLDSYRESIKDFYIFYSSNYKEIFTDELEFILKKRDYNAYKAYANTKKFPAIPTNYLNKLLSLFINIMNDENEDLDSRAFACIMIIESQTGLRVSELTSIKINQIKTETFDDKKCYYLLYKTFKRNKGNNMSSDAFIFINDLSYKAYSILTEIHFNNRNKMNSDILYVPSKAKNIPVKDDYIRNQIKMFSLKHYKELGCINPDSSLNDLYGKTTIEDLTIKTKRSITKYPELKKEDILVYPVTHQFRVTLCTELYNKGVPIEYISKYLTHLSEDMQDYYVRPKSNYQENIVYSKQILSDIVTGKAKLLGKNVTALTKKINDFIQNGKFNTNIDIDHIIDELLKKIPIRAKLGGICIKSSMLRDCSKDAKTDEFYCAYGVCPNHFHLFYMADITYDRYLTLKKTYTYNKNNNFLRQSEKEYFKLINIIKDMLIPELDELKKEIDNKGAEYLISRYPQLNFIINNYSDIYTEVTKWIK